ncbi:hypothetical protein YC2023_014901 [Brassica napus]
MSNNYEDGGVYYDPDETMFNNDEDGGVYYDPDETMFNNDEDGGLYFDPEDQELIKYHLLPKLEMYLQPKSKDEECEDFIVMKNVYDMEPWLLDHPNHLCSGRTSGFIS